MNVAIGGPPESICGPLPGRDSLAGWDVPLHITRWQGLKRVGKFSLRLQDDDLAVQVTTSCVISKSSGNTGFQEFRRGDFLIYWLVLSRQTSEQCHLNGIRVSLNGWKSPFRAS